MITAVMPTYGRKDVVFERGEGNYLYATDGRRYLDFTSGIAVNALGHCHPALVKALTEQGQKLWHTSNLFRIGNGEKLAKRLIEELVRRHHVLLQLRRRGDRGRHQADPQVSVHERPAQALQDHLLPGGVPRPPAERARRHRQREVPRRLRPAGARLQARAAQQHQRRARHDRRRDRRHPGRADPGRRRHPRHDHAVPQGPARDLRRVRPAAVLRRDPHGFRPHRQDVGLRLVGREARRRGDRQGHGRRLPDRRLHGDREGGGRHGAGHARLDLWRQSAGHGRGQRRARRAAEAGLHRRRAREGRVPQGPARRAREEASQGLRRAARHGLPAGHPVHRRRCRRATW